MNISNLNWQIDCRNTMLLNGYSVKDYNSIVVADIYKSEELDKFADNINKVLNLYNKNQQNFINTCISKMSDGGFNNYFSYKIMAECCPKKSIKNMQDYINYLISRGYTVDKIEYYPDYIFGIPEYDVYFPRYIHMRYKTGNELIIKANIEHYAVFYINDESKDYKFIDIGTLVNNRKYKFSDITDFYILFPYYPENINFKKYKNDIYADNTYYPWQMSIMMLDYFEDCLSYTNKYIEKTQDLIKYINNTILPILNNRGYDYTISSFNSVNEHSNNYNIFDVTLKSQITKNSISFSLSKFSRSAKLFVPNYTEVMNKCHRLEDNIFVDDLTTDEIIDIIETSITIDTDHGTNQFGEKNKILVLYNIMKNNFNKTLNINLIQETLKLCKKYKDDPEIGEFITDVVKYCKKVISKPIK